MQSAPDLLHGRIINGLKSGNSWTNSIQCVLKLLEKDGPDDNYYLSHECRNESVIHLDEVESESIFKPFLKSRTEGKFLTYSHGDKFYSVNGADNYALKSATIALPGSTSRLTLPTTESNWFSRVVCNDVAVRLRSHDEVHSLCLDCELDICSLFFCLEVEYTKSQKGFHIYAPVRYLNYSNNLFSGSKTRYLQLISGDCLFLLINEKVPTCGYISVAVSLSDYHPYAEATFCTYKLVENTEESDFFAASPEWNGVIELKVKSLLFYEYL